MKLTQQWLQEWFNSSIPVGDLADRLTMAGIEVESMKPMAPHFSQVVVGKILVVAPHPNASRLNCLTVDIGRSEFLEIVCGAPNVAVGMKAPCALVGAELPGGLVIAPVILRGVRSQGMMCSSKELGLPEETHAGLMALSDRAEPGQDIREFLGLDDVVMELKITPNRADCLSVLGIAREVASITQYKLNYPELRPALLKGKSGISVHLMDPEVCGLYLGCEIHFPASMLTTPEWMRRRLDQVGVASKSLPVDVTNYVMLECGQPMHVFDADGLQGPLSVRWARESEVLTLLNQQTIQLTPQDLVIADLKGPVALAGVMGGLASAVTVNTKRIWLECAFFEPQSIAQRARRHNLNSDAAYRFERGVDWQQARPALNRVISYLQACSEDIVVSEIEEWNGELPQRLQTEVRSARVNRILGTDLTLEQMQAALLLTGSKINPSAQNWNVVSPSYRFDLAREEDYIEEIARLTGYGLIPEQALIGPVSGANNETGRRWEIPQWWKCRGFQEIISYSFVAPESEQRWALKSSTVSLLNPLAQTMSVMRSSLFSGLLTALKFNVARRQDRLQLFEFGQCFSRLEGGQLKQTMFLGGLRYGSRFPIQWGTGSDNVDFFDLKGDVESFLGGFGIKGHEWVRCDHPGLHPGRSVALMINSEQVGWLGELHPKWVAHEELPMVPVIFEIQWESIMVPQKKELISDVSRFQPVCRDLSVLVHPSVLVGDMLQALRAARVAGVTDVTLFDVYQGERIEMGYKSVAFRVTMQDQEHSLTEGERSVPITALLEILEHRFQAKLR